LVKTKGRIRCIKARGGSNDTPFWNFGFLVYGYLRRLTAEKGILNCDNNHVREGGGLVIATDFYFVDHRIDHLHRRCRL